MPLVGGRIGGLVMGVPWARVGAVVLSAGLVAGAGAGSGRASSHLDAPHLVADPQVDGTDLYAHVCPDAPEFVCLIASYAPAFAGAGARYATDARYEINIDQRGTGRADLVYRWTFQPDQGGVQHYKLERVPTGKPAVTLVADGVTAPTGAGRGAATVTLPSGGRTLVGKSADAFFSNAHSVGLIMAGSPILPPFDFVKVLTGKVNSFVLQVPKAELALDGNPARNPVIGVWASASRQTMSLGSAEAGFRQLSRNGNPGLDVLTLFSVPDRFNKSAPADDADHDDLTDLVREPFGPRFVALQNPGVRAPSAPRLDLWQVFLAGIGTATGPIRRDLNAPQLNKDADPEAMVPAEELRLNMLTPPAAKPDRFGLVGGDVQGWPNGRRLADDVHTILARILLGEPVSAGAPRLLEADAAKLTGPGRPTTLTFPYLASAS